MIKKTITYTDFNETEITEDFWFNLTRAEIIEIEASYGEKGIQGLLDQVQKSQDAALALQNFKKIIGWAYGERDGVKFNKSDDLFAAFTHTEAYSELLLEFLNEPNKANEFFEALMPKKIRESVSAREKSEANMQGFKKKETSTVQVVADPVETVVASTPAPTPDGMGDPADMAEFLAWKKQQDSQKSIEKMPTE